MGKNKIFKVKEKEEIIKLDFGCGSNKAEGFIGVDTLQFPNVDVHMNIGSDVWPWEDNSVTEARASHFLEHLTSYQRCYFVNQLYRVLIPGGKCLIIVPHWASCRAYGDPTHVWPPVSEFWFYYLSKEWRKINAPHTSIEHNENGFDCDFEAQWGYSLRPDVASRNQEFQTFAMTNYKEVCQDIVATLTKKV